MVGRLTEKQIHELATVRRKLGLDELYLMGFSWGTALACSYILEKRPAGILGTIFCGPLFSAARWDADQREKIASMPDDEKRAIEDGEKKAQTSP